MLEIFRQLALKTGEAAQGDQIPFGKMAGTETNLMARRSSP
jgi:hypothetical protein